VSLKASRPLDAEVIIVGSGAAGAAAALGLSRRRVLMLDVGFAPRPDGLPDRPLRRALAEGEDLLPLLYQVDGRVQPGERKPQVSLKISGPLMEFVTRRPTLLPPDAQASFVATQSFARGGLANAWGGGTIRFTDAELRHFPCDRGPLDRWFDALTEHIGIAGDPADDLSEYYGSGVGLLPPHPLSPLARRLYDRYRRHAAAFGAAGLRLGRPRLAVLSAPHRGRRPFVNYGHEYFAPGQDGIYTPWVTVRELIGSGRLRYRANVLVERFVELDDCVAVRGRDVRTGEVAVFRAQELLLAAGALNTARIVLRSRDDYVTRLPLLDNPVVLLPVIDPLRIGVAVPEGAFTGAEVVLVADRGDGSLPVQGAAFNLLGPLRSGLIAEYPLTMAGNLAAVRELLPAMLMVQVFYPDHSDPRNGVSLRPDGALSIGRGAPPPRGIETRLAIRLLRLGMIAPFFMAQRPAAGSSIHYAGTLPMRSRPRTPFETDPAGRLAGTARVRVVDASVFPVLPAKNLTLMAMANAARVGASLGP
jgi:choline dehydrogenase-like flavoprotein